MCLDYARAADKAPALVAAATPNMFMQVFRGITHYRQWAACW